MTINKLQSIQFLNVCGLNLENACFSHGQLYVACSQVGKPSALLVLAPDSKTYNCEDPNCYSDLARLRGLKYVTWEDKDKFVQQDEGRGPGGGSHAKFTNYSFDVKEFLRLVELCASYVRSRQDFKNFVEASLLKNKHDEL